MSTMQKGEVCSLQLLVEAIKRVIGAVKASIKTLGESDIVHHGETIRLTELLEVATKDLALKQNMLAQAKAAKANKMFSLGKKLPRLVYGKIAEPGRNTKFKNKGKTIDLGPYWEFMMIQWEDGMYVSYDREGRCESTKESLLEATVDLMGYGWRKDIIIFEEDVWNTVKKKLVFAMKLQKHIPTLHTICIEKH